MMIGSTLSERYRLERRMGQGGMAIVYGGFDTVLRRRVAIKVLRDSLAADSDFVARFYSEAQHAAKLSHPNIVNTFDVGNEGETYYIVMELVDGPTLAEMIEHDRRLPEPVAIDFAVQLCSGLAYAHRQGILHRDVKPANILVTKDDVVKLSDFGIARAVTTQTMSMTQPGMVMGSVAYISPEQAQGHEIHETSDLYSLGVVLYQMLSGKLPYSGESPITIALKHVSSPVPPLPEELATSPALAAIVATLLRKEPADRFPSAVEVAKALREARERPLIANVRPTSNGVTSGHSVPPGIPNPKPRPSAFPDRPAAAVAEDVVGLEAVDDVRKRSDRTLRLVFVAILALGLAIFGGYSVFDRSSVGKPAAVAVVDLVGARVDDARKKLEALGLQARIVEVTSLTVPAKVVVREEPNANAEVAAGSVVALYVSTGMPTVELIDVREYSSDDAQRYLRNAKLVPKIAEIFAEAPKGTVLSQKPAPATAIAIHSTVTLVVSRGPQPVAVPDLVSLSLGDARAAATARRVRLVVGERAPSDQIPADTVMSQSPAAGDSLARDGAIVVVVSAGAPQLSVPYLGGKTAADASTALASLGLVPSIEYVVDPSAPLGTVLKQTPDPKSAVKKGSTIVLAVAVPGSVPDVAAKNPSDAQAMLLSAGYKIGNTAYVQEGTEGTVVRTEPAIGSSLRPGETVMLYVSGTPTEPQ